MEVGNISLEQESELLKACRTGETANLADLIDRGLFDVNGRILNGNTPLTIAVQHKSEAVIELLLDKEADINLSDSRGYTPLHLAVSCLSSGIVKILLQEGADMTIANVTGRKPFYLAFDIYFSNCNLGNGSSPEPQKLSEIKNILSLLINQGCALHIPLNMMTTKELATLMYFKLCKAIFQNDWNGFREIINPIDRSLWSDIDEDYQPGVFAVRFRRNDMVKSLICKGINPREIFFESVKNQLGGYLILYIERGLNVNVKTRTGQCALNMICKEVFLKHHKMSQDQFITLAPMYCKFFTLFLEAGVLPETPGFRVSYPYHDYCPGDCRVIDYLKKVYIIDPKYAEEAVNRFLPDRTVWEAQKVQNLQHYITELDALRAITIENPSTTNITLYDYMFLKPWDTMRYTGNAYLINTYVNSKRDFRSVYPAYGFALNLKFRKSSRRRLLINAANNLVRDSFGTTLPEKIQKELYSNFTNEGLHRFLVPQG